MGRTMGENWSSKQSKYRSPVTMHRGLERETLMEEAASRPKTNVFGSEGIITGISVVSVSIDHHTISKSSREICILLRSPLGLFRSGKVFQKSKGLFKNAALPNYRAPTPIFKCWCSSHKGMRYIFAFRYKSDGNISCTHEIAYYPHMTRSTRAIQNTGAKAKLLAV